MVNSNVLFFPAKENKSYDFDLMHSLLRYVYAQQKKTPVVDQAEIEENNSLQHTYYCRAALKRRLKQIALNDHQS